MLAGEFYPPFQCVIGLESTYARIKKQFLHQEIDTSNEIDTERSARVEWKKRGDCLQ